MLSSPWLLVVRRQAGQRARLALRAAPRGEQGAVALRLSEAPNMTKWGEWGLAPSGPVRRGRLCDWQEAAAHGRGLISVVISLPPSTLRRGNGHPPDANPTGWFRFRLGSGVDLGEHGGRLCLSVLSLPVAGAPRVAMGHRPGF